MRALFAAVLILGLQVLSGTYAHADSLSAESVFGGAQPTEETSSDTQSAESKLERTRQLFANKEHSADGSKPSTPAWKTESEGSLVGTGFKMLQGLGICVGLLFVGVHFFKKYNPQNNPRAAGRSMRVLERMPIAPKTSLVLAVVEGRKILMAVGSDRVSFYSQHSQDENAASFDNSLDLLCQDDVKTTDA
ncbi:MAG: FliO/MopB family protein [Deltaproteobacteria bacterium]|nr:FliO/MopB family protein [Deltaproteobacteria bacterium]